MQEISDETMFSNSGKLVGTGSGFGLQLARDGKIYNAIPGETDPDFYLGVIHNPWKTGEECLYEKNALNMYPGEVGWSLPNILLDYLTSFRMGR